MAEKVVVGKLPIDIEFYFTKFSPFCETARQAVYKVVKKYGNKINYVEVNVDTKQGAKKANDFGITFYPTILIERDVRLTGVPREELLDQAIKHVLEDLKKVELSK